MGDERFEWDAAKRERTLRERGIDFADAIRVFDGLVRTTATGAPEQGEVRYLSVGTVHDRVLAVVWTWRDGRRRIISARLASNRERREYRGYRALHG